MAYADADDMVDRFDVNILGDLLADDGNPIAPSELSSNARLTKLLSQASGTINAAVLQAKRYTVADLAAMTGDDREYLVALTCGLAFQSLQRRKNYSQPSERDKQDQQWCDEQLERIRTGKHVFNLEANKEAGLPDVSTPTRIEVQTWNLLVDSGLRGRLYPPRRH